jgi:hypothetical protein
MFKREVVMSPAWDKRDPDPEKDYGVHCVEIRFLLTGAKGIMQFVFITGWHLPHVQKEMNMRVIDSGNPMTLEALFLPQGFDVGYHSPVPMYEGQKSMPSCQYLDGKDCYYDGSSLSARTMLDLLIREGSEAVWKRLEELYYGRFGDQLLPTVDEILKDPENAAIPEDDKVLEELCIALAETAHNKENHRAICVYAKRLNPQMRLFCVGKAMDIDLWQYLGKYQK